MASQPAEHDTKAQAPTKPRTRRPVRRRRMHEELVEILRGALLKRQIENSSMDVGDSVHSGKRFHLTVKFKQGIDKEVAKKLVKLIKDSKIKVQAAIQGDEVRVTGKKRDDLQETMALVRGAELGQPMQFQNFRD